MFHIHLHIFPSSYCSQLLQLPHPTQLIVDINALTIWHVFNALTLHSCCSRAVFTHCFLWEGESATMHRPAVSTQTTVTVSKASKLRKISHHALPTVQSYKFTSASKVASEAICKWGGHNAGALRRPNFFLMCPSLFSCAPTWGGTTIVCYRLRDNWSGEVGRGAIKVMGLVHTHTH